MAWTPQTNRSHYEYGAGSWSRYYWDRSVNPNATPELCLANCTTLAYGRVMEEGYPAPVTRILNANLWHTVVNTAEGWELLNYYSGMLLMPGDVLEWSAMHVAVVETQSTSPYVSASWYTPRDESLSLQAISDYFQTTESLQNRFYHYVPLWRENNNAGDGADPLYVLRYNGSEPPEPPTPTETPEITITPSAYFKTMSSTADYVDFPYSITITGIPAGETVSGGNTYPDLSRVYNTGWSYSSYTIEGVTYQTATKQQTLRYYREGVSAYATVKYMYFNLTFTNGSIHSTTPMTINVQQKESTSKLLAVLNLIRKSPCKTIIKI